MTKVDASDLCRLLQKRASSAMAHHRGPSPSRPELEVKLKSEEIRPPAPASAAAAPVAPVPVAVPQFHKHQPLLSADEVIAAHRRKHARYFTMLRVGIPRDTVEQAMRLAGVDPAELDGPHLVVDAATATGDSSAGVPDARSSITAVSGSEAGRPGHHHHALGRKKALRKRLYWDVKVHNPSLGSEPNKAHSRGMWGHLAQPIVAMSDETKAQLEKLFAKEAITSESDFKSSITSRKKAPVRISLLDTKKAQNIGIALARVKLSLPQLVKELIHMNPTVLCAAQLQGLLDMWPDRKELEAIDEFTGDRTLLGTAEQFFLETRAIMRFREKLRCLIFKQEFPLRVHELRESINLVIRAINQVVSSPALQQIMGFILQLGNFLNCGGGTCSDSLVHQYPHPHQLVASPRVVGFSLSSLTKLGQTKAFAGGVTFLQFAVQAVDRDCPHLVHFHKEINLISKCAKVSIQSLLVEQKALEAGWKALVHEAQAGIPAAALDEDCEDDENELYLRDITDGSLIVSSILTHFAVEVENELDAIQELLEQLMESKQRFLEYFDEQDSAEELDVLLRYIARFADEFSQQHARLAETKHAVDKAS